jgi:hypothetical protein
MMAASDSPQAYSGLDSSNGSSSGRFTNVRQSWRRFQRLSSLLYDPARQTVRLMAK